MLVYGLLSATFIELPERTFTCPVCNKPTTSALNPQSMLDVKSIVKWSKDEFVADYYQRVEVIKDALYIDFGVPNEEDKISLLNKTSNDELRQTLETEGEIFNTLETIVMVTKRIIVKKPDGTDIVLDDKLNDIYEFIMNADLNTQQNIILAFKEVDIDIKEPNYQFSIKCEHCDNVFPWKGVSPEAQFFLQLSSLY